MMYVIKNLQEDYINRLYKNINIRLNRFQEPYNEN